MVKKILIGIGAIVVILLAVIATRPSIYHVDRSITITAPADVVFAQVVDFKNFGAWSPWDKLDPNMKKTFDGPERAVGASYTWVGNDEVGEGQMTITELRENEFVGQKLEFIKPFASVAESSFTLVAERENTTLTWAMDGKNDFLGKAFGLMMDMDKMIGADFEKGLASLKTIAEADAQQRKAAEETARAQADAAAAALEAAPSDTTAAAGATAPAEMAAPAATGNP